MRESQTIFTQLDIQRTSESRSVSLFMSLSQSSSSLRLTDFFSAFVRCLRNDDDDDNDVRLMNVGCLFAADSPRRMRISVHSSSQLSSVDFRFSLCMFA